MRHHRTVRILAMSLLAVSALTVATACRGGKKDETPTPTATPAASATVPAAGAAAAVAASLPATLAPFDASKAASIPPIDGIAVDLSGVNASLRAITLPPANIGSSVNIGTIRQPTFRVGAVQLTRPTIPTIPGGGLPPGITIPPGFTFP